MSLLPSLTNEIFPSIVERLLNGSGQTALFGGNVIMQQRLKHNLSAIFPGWNVCVGQARISPDLNWLRGDVCDNVYLNRLGAIAYLSFLLGDDQAGRPQDQTLLASCKAHGTDQCPCLYRALRHTVVAPSFVREVRDPILLEIWRNALEALRQADGCIIVGYSLPPEDVAIGSMFLHASRGRDRQDHPRVVVVQQEEKEPERMCSGGESRQIQETSGCWPLK